MKTIDIPTPVELAKMGSVFNKKLLVDFTVFAGRKGLGLDTAVSFSLLAIANYVSDAARRDHLLSMLHGTTPMTLAERKALKIQRWSPVVKAVPIYAKIIAKQNRPDLDTLVDQQYDKISKVAPSWSVLMGDKMYAIAHFWQKEPDDEIAQLLMPFGKAVQVAFATITGVTIDGQPSATHHQYLHKFEQTWAKAAKSNVIDLNSGLHKFGFELLQK